jgi:hypothetical protein
MADMDSHTLEGLTLRLEAAERGLRGAKRAMWTGSILIVLAVGGAVWWMGTRAPVTGIPETVEAQRFIVRDGQGAARAMLEQSEGGATQLVFFRDPLAGEGWRQHASTGPFSFGARAVSAGSQLMLSDRDSGNFQLTTGNMSFTRGDKPSVLLATDGGQSRIWLSDSTGNMQVLSAGLLADVAAKPSVRASHPPKRRHGR